MSKIKTINLKRGDTVQVPEVDITQYVKDIIGATETAAMIEAIEEELARREEEKDDE